MGRRSTVYELQVFTINIFLLIFQPYMIFLIHPFCTPFPSFSYSFSFDSVSLVHIFLHLALTLIDVMGTTPLSFLFFLVIRVNNPVIWFMVHFHFLSYNSCYIFIFKVIIVLHQAKDVFFMYTVHCIFFFVFVKFTQN